MSEHEDKTARKARVRQLVYIHGFDMRGPRHYRGLMARELERYGALRNTSVDVGKMKRKPGGVALWRLASGTPDALNECDVHYLGWEKIVQARLKIPLSRKLFVGIAALSELAFGGPVLAMWRRNWPTAAFMAYTIVFMFALVALSVAPMAAVALTGAWLWTPLALAVPALLLRLSLITDQWSYFWYLVCDLISIRNFARGDDAGMDRRVDEFAAYIGDLIKATPPDGDVIICAHSSGTFVALRALDRLFARRPNLASGRKRKPIFLCLGSAFGFTAFFRGASTFGEAERLVARNALLWADIFEPRDVMCCAMLDPAAERADPPTGKSRAFFRRADFEASLAHETYREIRRSFFDYHFGYLMAPTAPGAFDFYDLAVGESPWASVVRKAERGRYAE